MRRAKIQVAVWHYGPVSGTQGLEKQIPASGLDAASRYGWKTKKLTPSVETRYKILLLRLRRRLRLRIPHELSVCLLSVGERGVDIWRAFQTKPRGVLRVCQVGVALIMLSNFACLWLHAV